MDFLSIPAMLPHMKTPREFAKRYIQREIYKPVIANISSLLYLRHNPIIYEVERIFRKSFQDKLSEFQKNPLAILEESSIDPEIKKSISIALDEFARLLNVDLESLRKLNRECVKKKKVVVNSSNESEGIGACDGNNKLYPTKEIDIISSWTHIFYSGLYRKVLLKVEAKKISEMLSVPIHFSEERLRKFFCQVLQIVIFTYLHQYAEISKHEAIQLTVKIINSYVESRGLTFVGPLSEMDIENTLY